MPHARSPRYLTLAAPALSQAPARMPGSQRHQRLLLPRHTQRPHSPPRPQPRRRASLSSSLGLYTFPAKNQTAQQQANDETYCFGWAKTQRGIDPMNIKPHSPDQQTAANQADAATQGARASSGRLPAMRVPERQLERLRE